jgi:hypothetical protein
VLFSSSLLFLAIMLLYQLILLALVAIGLADKCASTASNDPGCTLTYTATQPTQVGPFSTVYEAIVTTFLFVSCPAQVMPLPRQC